MSSRFADPSAIRTWSPIYPDESQKRAPPSPSNKAPPAKKLDAKSRAVSEEPGPPAKPSQTVSASSPESDAEPYMDESSSKRVVVDMDVFGQILELDEDDSHEFSQVMVNEYLGQTQATIKLMDELLANRELTQLGKRGHFLKGSSAALGIVQVQEICEKIQHLGNRVDPDHGPEAGISADDALERIKSLLVQLKVEHAAAAKWLKKFFEGSKP